MESIFFALHVLLAIGLIALVLLQQGRGADAGAAFGSGASGTVFGARGSASFLTKMTALFAALFFITSLSLAYLAAQRPKATGSVVDQISISQPATAEQDNVQPAPANDSAAPADVPAAVNQQPETDVPAAE